MNELTEPAGFGDLLTRLKATVRAARVRAHRVADTEFPDMRGLGAANVCTSSRLSRVINRTKLAAPAIT